MNDTELLLKRFAPKDGKVITADPQVRAARFSPCGKMLVAGGFDGRVRRWNVAAEEPAELPALEGHHAWIDGLAFRAQGDLLFTADSWGQLACWSGYAAEKPEGKWRHEKAHDGWIRELATSIDGKLLASCGSDQAIRVWNVEDGAQQHEIAAGRDVLRVAWLPNGTLVSGDDRGFVKLWRVDGTLIRQLDASVLYTLSRLQDVGGVHALAVDQEGKLLAAGGTIPKNGGTVTGPPTLLVFDIASGEQKHRLTLGADNDCYVADIHFHAEGFLSVVTYGTPGAGQLLYVSLEDGKAFFTKKISNAHSISWHPEGRRLAVVATNPGSNGNGRPLDKEGNYLGNKSPIHLLQVMGEVASPGGGGSG
jgi:WD40 repeat protein